MELLANSTDDRVQLDYSAYFKIYIEFIMGTGNVQFVIDQDYRILFDNCDNI